MSGLLYEVGFPSERVEKEFFKVLSKAVPKERERILEWFDIWPSIGSGRGTGVFSMTLMISTGGFSYSPFVGVVTMLTTDIK